MAQSKSKNRLGRGLGALISGGAPAKSTFAASAVPAQKIGAGFKAAASAVISVEHKASTPAMPAAAKKSASASFPAAAKTISVATKAADAFERMHDTHSVYLEIPLDHIDASPHQPRRKFAPEAVQELAESIRSEGLMQPIVVRKAGDRFELIAGERRLRACRSLKMAKISARLVEVSDASSAVMALIENLQREGLNAIEEAGGYASLMRDFDLTQEDVAQRVGKGRATVANALRLLQLDREIQGYILQGLISAGHAKVLLGIEDAARRSILARKILEEGLSVREAEQAVRRLKAENNFGHLSSKSSTVSSAEYSAIRDLEKRLASSLNAKVQLKHTPRKGRLIIEYYGNEDLQRILEKTGLG